jgi:hypothetical protein
MFAASVPSLTRTALRPGICPGSTQGLFAVSSIPSLPATARVRAGGSVAAPDDHQGDDSEGAPNHSDTVPNSPLKKLAAG